MIGTDKSPGWQQVRKKEDERVSPPPQGVVASTFELV